MESKSIVTVKEWFFDKVNEEAHRYNMYLVGESTICNGIQMMDHTKFRVENVIRETEKAVYVELDAETSGGHAKSWKTWIPKSVIVA